MTLGGLPNTRLTDPRSGFHIRVALQAGPIRAGHSTMFHTSPHVGSPSPSLHEPHDRLLQAGRPEDNRRSLKSSDARGRDRSERYSFQNLFPLGKRWKSRAVGSTEVDCRNECSFSKPPRSYLIAQLPVCEIWAELYPTSASSVSTQGYLLAAPQHSQPENCYLNRRINRRDGSNESHKAPHAAAPAGVPHLASPES